MSKPQSDKLALLRAFRQSDSGGKAALVLSTWFGAGLLPLGPGTFGTLASFPLAIGLIYLDPFYRLLGLAVLVAGATWSSGRHERLTKTKDPREVVVDEVAGFLVATIFLPPSWLTFGCGFVLFRFFDILKPFPIRRLEKAFRGGAGVVVDDLAAGLYAFLSLKVLLYFVT
jgi:phosphatidylglycerophosphatase A